MPECVSIPGDEGKVFGLKPSGNGAKLGVSIPGDEGKVFGLKPSGNGAKLGVSIPGDEGKVFGQRKLCASLPMRCFYPWR